MNSKQYSNQSEVEKSAIKTIMVQAKVELKDIQEVSTRLMSLEGEIIQGTVKVSLKGSISYDVPFKAAFEITTFQLL